MTLYSTSILKRFITIQGFLEKIPAEVVFEVQKPTLRLNQ